MGGAGYAGNAGDWQSVCAAARQAGSGPDRVRFWFETWFVPFEVDSGSGEPGLFTGYYEPEIRASRVRRDVYQTPVYGLPRDLVTADLGLFRSNLAGIRITARVTNQKLVPFPARSQIDAEGLSDAPVLLYANDPVDVFFLHIQGSGRARLDNGAMLRLAYAGQNGRAFTPIGRTLIERGEIDRRQMSMQAIRRWLETHAGRARQTMESDASYVFFRELPLGDPRLGSPGSEGIALTPETSIAVDPAVHALGMPIYVVTHAPDASPARADTAWARLCVAQDTGGAIKGARRADIFWGFDSRAESIAGRMKSTGSLYVFLPRRLAARIVPGFADGAR